jgi:hypothetical protein
MKRLMSLLIFLLIPATCSAGTIYLDIAATGCTGGGIANSNYDPATRSCGSGSEKVYAGNYPYEAGQSLSNRDALYIRGGTYYEDVTGKSGYNWSWGSLMITASNVTVKNYDRETVWISGGPSLTSVVNHPNNAMNISSGSNSHFSGLHIYGCVMYGGTDNTIENFDLSGGWDHQSPIGSDAWYDVIRWFGTRDTLRNSSLHDNYNHGTGMGGSENKAISMHINDQGSIIENCRFYNPVAGYSQSKYQPDNPTESFQYIYRYNVFEPAPFYINCNADSNGGKQIDDIFYQNIFLGSPGGFRGYGQPTTTPHKILIYNNVFYNAPQALFDWGTVDNWDFFNNIIYTDSASTYPIKLDDGKSIPSSIIDYNTYYKTGSGQLTFYWNYAIRGNTLGEWQSFTSSQGWPKDVHSSSANPGFLNASGTFSNPSDFKRASYPQNGRGGLWPSVMGAYISGSEIIGPPTGKRPSPPRNLR